MEQTFIHLVRVWEPLIYLIIFLGMIIEGEFFLFGGVFLAHQGILHMPTVLIVAGIGFLLGDFLWYFASKHLFTKIPYFERLSQKVIGFFDKHIEDRPFFVIFLSKFAYGLHRAIIIRAGQKMPLATFARAVIISDTVWFIVVSLLATALSTALGPVRHILHYAGFVVCGVMLLMVFAEKIVAVITTRVLK